MFVPYKSGTISTVLTCLFIYFSAALESHPTNSTPCIISKPTQDNSQIVGVHTMPFNASNFQAVYYVNSALEEDGEGSRESPAKDLRKILHNIDQSAAENIAICVAQGEYNHTPLVLKSGTSIFGGFSAENWDRDVEKFTTTLTGDGERRILVAGDDCKIDGFYFVNGSIRGTGGAILCKGSPSITNNHFIGNRSLKPASWSPKYWHETAHNGGAIYGNDHANPTIEHNVFIDNSTENGRGAAIAFDSHCHPTIKKNAFINNIAGTDDPMRSSDGGAISIFDWCHAIITDNYFLNNRALARNDGGAVFVALWSSADILGNHFVNSQSGDDAGALFIGGQEHRYDGPLDPIPPRDSFYVSIRENIFLGNKNSSMNSGAMRFTMESRGEFVQNIVAHNNGIYFQRSEVMVRNNIILDDLLFIETKEGLKQGSIIDNFVWGDMTLTVDATVRGNRFRSDMNMASQHIFKDDGLTLKPLSAVYHSKGKETKIFVPKSHIENSLVGRVVNVGNRWGIVKSNTGHTIYLWGDFYGQTSINVLPTYTFN